MNHPKNVLNPGFSMKKIFSLFFLFASFGLFTSEVALAEETSGRCQSGSVTTIDKSNEDLTGCDAARIAYKSNPKAEEDFQRNVNIKLAKFVAVQTRQILQELGASSSFYEQSSQSFLIGSSPEVVKSCKFDFIKDLENRGCHGKITAVEKEKIAMVSSALRGENQKSPLNSSLMDGVLQIYGTSKYGQGFLNPKDKQCPLDDSAYPLHSQMTEVSALEIISMIKSEDSGASRLNYAKYPQLAMIKEADKQNPGFLKKFENYMKAFDPKKDQAKVYFSQFYFHDENKKTIGKGVAHRCEQVRSSLSSFICNPLTKLTTENSLISAKLFNGYDPSLEFQDQDEDVRSDSEAFKAYALMCEERTEAKKIPAKTRLQVISAKQSIHPVDCLKLKPENDTIDNWYNCFNAGVRKEETTFADAAISKNFCERWSCQEKSVKETPSCKNGGPLSSKDLASLNLSDGDILKQIAYIQSLEEQNKTRSQYAFDSRNPVETNNHPEIKKSLSDFDLNAFGGEATLSFVGIPTNPEVLVLVNQELKEKGIVSTSKEEIKQIVNRGEDRSTRLASNQTLERSPASERSGINEVRSDTNFYPNNTYKNKNEASIPVTPSKNQATKSEKATDGNSDEVQQMVSDLEKIMKDQKQNKEQKTSLAKKTIPEQGEKVESQSNEQSLSSWAKNLKNKESALAEREHFANMRDAEFWRRDNELRNREHGLGRKLAQEEDLENDKTHSSQITKKDERPKTAAKSRTELALEVSATSKGLILTPERLNKINKIDLTNFGVNIEEPFVISIKMNGKLIHVRVAKVAMKGKTFLAPRLNEDNKEVQEVILTSPLFKEFRYFYEKENATYFPIK